MTLLNLTYAPDPIFKKHAETVAVFDTALETFITDMFETLEFENGVGMAAPMVGVLQRIIIADLHEEGVSQPLTMINPDITYISEETQEFEEASLCFIGISAPITRARRIRVTYHDMKGALHQMEAEGFLASVIQHEIDYLNGITFVDHLSPLKRNMLLKKMQKSLKFNPPHRHGAGCNH